MEGEAEAFGCGQYSARRWCRRGQRCEMLQQIWYSSHVLSCPFGKLLRQQVIHLWSSRCCRLWGQLIWVSMFVTCFVANSWPPCQTTEWRLVRLVDDFLLHRLLEQERRRDTVPPAVPRLLTSLPVAMTDYWLYFSWPFFTDPSGFLHIMQEACLLCVVRLVELADPKLFSFPIWTEIGLQWIASSISLTSRRSPPSVRTLSTAWLIKTIGSTFLTWQAGPTGFCFMWVYLCVLAGVVETALSK